MFLRAGSLECHRPETAEGVLVFVRRAVVATAVGEAPPSVAFAAVRKGSSEEQFAAGLAVGAGLDLLRLASAGQYYCIGLFPEDWVDTRL